MSGMPQLKDSGNLNNLNQDDVGYAILELCAANGLSGGHFPQPPLAKTCGPHWVFTPHGWAFPLGFQLSDDRNCYTLIVWGPPDTPTEQGLENVAQQLAGLQESVQQRLDAPPLQVVHGDANAAAVLKIADQARAARVKAKRDEDPNCGIIMP